MRRDEPKTTVSVPGHSQLRVGTLRVILHQTGLTVEELIEFL